MHYTYIIKSQEYDKFYVGHTSNLANRLQWHNEGKSKWSKRFLPWEIVYYQEFSDKSEAIKREIQIKRSKSKKYIERLVAAVGPVV